MRMTYLGFLLIFVVPALVVVAGLAGIELRRTLDRAAVWRPGLLVLAVLVVAAVVWTTPWDSWLIGQGVWSYSDGAVAATIWRVPVEEFLFMTGQTAAVGLWTLWLLQRHRQAPGDARGLRMGHACWGAAWLLAAGGGLVLVTTTDDGTYLGSMLLWFGPLIAIQSIVGSDILSARRRTRLMAIGVPVLYLWIADRIAIGDGVWHISTDQTFNVHILGLPVEEAIFFSVTTLLVANGLILAVDPVIQRRLARWVPRLEGVLPATRETV
jgi:lycopene cyclase domain-containing protein